MSGQRASNDGGSAPEKGGSAADGSKCASGMVETESVSRLSVVLGNTVSKIQRMFQTIGPSLTLGVWCPGERFEACC